MNIRIVRADEEDVVCSLTDFLAANEFELDEMADIVTALKTGRSYKGGGGAAEAWEVRPA